MLSAYHVPLHKCNSLALSLITGILCIIYEIILLLLNIKPNTIYPYSDDIIAFKR